MYDVFDDFIGAVTWHTTHPMDDERFYRGLEKVVRKRHFNPDAMGEYFRKKVGISETDEGHPLWEAVERRVGQAWSIPEYVRTIDPIDKN